MGNTKETWMEEKINGLHKSNSILECKFTAAKNISKIEYFIIHKVFQKIIDLKFFRKQFESSKKE